MFSNFLVTNKVKVTNDLFSGKIPIQNNPSVGNSYRTTRIFSPASHESDPTIKFMTKQISGPPNFVPAIPTHFTTLTLEQSGLGLNLNEILEHPLKVSEEEFDNLNRASDPNEPSSSELSDSKIDYKEQNSDQFSSGSDSSKDKDTTKDRPSDKSVSDLPIEPLPTSEPEVVTETKSQAQKRKVDEVKEVTKKPKRVRQKKFDFQLV